jgi:hypothetical protein
MAAKTKTEKLRGEFEGKYGAPTDSNKKVLIGMRGGKAVYGDEWDAVDTGGDNVINNTFSQNQAELNRISAELKRSGGMYNPSPKDIARMENMYPSDAKDTQDQIQREGAKPMVGPDSPAASAMRVEPMQNANNARFLATLRNQQAQKSQEQPVTSTIAPPSIQRGAYNNTNRSQPAPVATPAPVTAPVTAPLPTKTPSLDLVASNFLELAGYGPIKKKPAKGAISKL